jgi:DNA-directed RNA polymerase subunit RPC12/RpoP
VAKEKPYKCPDCGSSETMEAVELTASYPWGTGYMIWVCVKCGTPVADKEPRFVGF